MKKVACLALVGALGLFGCGGGGSGDDDDDIVFPDASVGPDYDAAPTGECNPVSQTGCMAGQKCAMVVDQLDPFIGHVGCTADGTDAVGAACTEAAAVGTSDSCAKGGECYNGFCHELCTTVNDQCADGTCQTFVDGNGNPLPTEICLFACDPLAQDCVADNEGCYVARDAVCVATSGGGAEGAPCQYANSCDPGFACLGDPGSCRPFCGPFALGWSDDGMDPPTLLSPTCCTSECTDYTKQCTLPNQVCWPIVNSTGEIVHDTAGFCITDADISSDTFVCDCSIAAGSDKCSEVM